MGGKYVNITLFQAEEAANRAPNPDKDQKKVDEMLSSLGIAPVSGKGSYCQ